MKFKLMFLLSALMMLVGCEKNIIGIETDAVIVPPEPTALNKKGSCYSYNSEKWSHKTSDSKGHWFYHWGNSPREEIPANVEYIPMFWGKSSVNEENLNNVQQLINEGRVNYVLGFNEPDGAAQANMTVDEAIERWDELESLGVPLGSPATVNPLNDWMIEFMERAEQENLRVDFVTLHSYGGPNPATFINKVKETYERFGKPIWITEFAVADWGATSAENNKYSVEQIMEYMRVVLPALDDIEYVHRYTWFDGYGRAPLASSALFDEEGNLTALGQLYADHAPNTEIGPGTDTEFEPVIDPDNLFVNPGFESGQIEPWGGFKNGVLSTDATEPLTGNFVGRIENNDGSLLYELTLEPGETYELKYNTKWADVPGSTITGKIRNQTAGAVLFDTNELSVSTEWQEDSITFTLPDSVGLDDVVRIVFYKPQRNPPLPPLFFDDMSLKVVE